MYQLTHRPDIIFKIEGNLYIPTHPGNVDYQEYLKWVAEGNTAAPYVAPPPTPFELREAAFLADTTRAEMVDKLKNATPDQIKTYITNNVTNLAEARTMLIRLALAVALLVRN